VGHHRIAANRGDGQDAVPVKKVGDKDQLLEVPVNNDVVKVKRVPAKSDTPTLYNQGENATKLGLVVGGSRKVPRGASYVLAGPEVGNSGEGLGLAEDRECGVATMLGGDVPVLDANKGVL